MGDMRLGIAVSSNDTWDFIKPTFEAMKDRYRVNVYSFFPGRFPFFKERLNHFSFRRSFRGFLEKNDVVFFEWASGLLSAATRLPKTCKIVTRLHRYELYTWSEKINWDRVDGIILVSNAMRQKFINLFPEQEHKTTVIPVGIPLEKFYPRKREFTGEIGTLCHLNPRKRIYELVLAFKELLLIRDGFRLHIAGGNEAFYADYFDALKSLVSRMGIEDKVIFYDQVTNTHEWYSKIDIFISNSYSEGLQVAAMEAMASGCYCLSHWWEGADELLPKDQLYFTDSQFVEKVLGYCELPKAARERELARMVALSHEKFDLKKINQSILQFVELVARGVI